MIAAVTGAGVSSTTFRSNIARAAYLAKSGDCPLPRGAPERFGYRPGDGELSAGLAARREYRQALNLS